MTTRTINLWADGEVLFADDLNDTINDVDVPILTGGGTAVGTGSKAIGSATVSASRYSDEDSFEFTTYMENDGASGSSSTVELKIGGTTIINQALDQGGYVNATIFSSKRNPNKIVARQFRVSEEQNSWVTSKLNTILGTAWASNGFDVEVFLNNSAASMTGWINYTFKGN